MIFVFLRNAWATIIPALAVPFSLLGACAVMALFNFSLDNLSMMALILSIGFVVDDAIVMLENIVRHVEKGETPLEAALKGSKEIGFTIVSMTVSLAAVFIPLLFLTGILGRLFREFAVTITAAILISGVVSVTLTPMLCSRFLSAKTHGSKGPSLEERLFARLLALYERSLGWVLRHRPIMLIGFAGVFAATVMMFQVVPKGFIPDQDADWLMMNLRAAQGTSYDEMTKGALAVSEILHANPYVTAVMLSAGGGGGAMNTAREIIQLTPRAERPFSAAQIAQQMRAQVSRFPGFQAFVIVPPTIQIGGRSGNGSYQFTVQSIDPDQLYSWAGRLEAEMAKLPQIQDVTDDMQMKSPRVDLVIDRDKAAALQLNAAQLSNTLYSGFGPRWSSTIYGTDNQYRVLLELDPKYQQHVDALESIGFKAPNGAWIPLQSVAKFKESVGPQTINHSGQLPSVSLSFGLRPGVALGTAVDAVNLLAATVLPATVTARFEGTAQAFQQSMTNLGLLLFIAIGVVYIVLGILYESYIHPITILSGLPTAGSRGAGHVVGVRSRAERLRLRRPDHADRHRQEERDHADRLRARGRAGPWQVAVRCDLRRLRDPVPSDHDDDDGGAVRGVADCAGGGIGRRGVATAGSGDCRRAAGVAVDYVVPDAGGLYLHGDDVLDQANRGGGCGRALSTASKKPRRPGNRVVSAFRRTSKAG